VRSSSHAGRLRTGCRGSAALTPQADERLAQFPMIARVKSWFEVVPTRGFEFTCARGEPSLREVLLMFGVTLALHRLTTCRLRYPWEPPDVWFDRPQYLEAAAVVRHWHFGGGHLPRAFMGFPSVIAGFSRMFSVPAVVA
jgi:hypothetical protein